MSELSSRGLAKRKGRIVALIVSIIIILISGLIVALSFLHEKKDSETPSLTVISYDNRVYYGGDFSVEVAYKYEDGRIEIPTSNNAIKYECSENIVSVDGSGQLQVVKNIFDSNAEYQEHPVVITISSTNKNVASIQVPIKVVPVYTYSITKYYYDEETLELKSEFVPAWSEQTVDEISDPTLANYNFDNWYVEKIGDKAVSTEMKFHSEDKYLWGDKITIRPKFYADVQLNVDGMPIGEKSISPVKVYYDEPIEDGMFPSSVETSAEGWTFGGWFTEKGGSGNENGISGGVFKAKKPTLYAKWEGKATLHLTQEIVTDESGEIILDKKQRTVGTFSGGATSAQVDVIYHGKIETAFPEPTYRNASFQTVGTFDGWYTEEYGDGKYLDTVTANPIYNITELDLFDKIKYEVRIIYQDGREPTVIDTIYGKSLLNLNSAIQPPTKDGWSLGRYILQQGLDDSINITDDPTLVDTTESLNKIIYSYNDILTVFVEWHGTIHLDAYINKAWNRNISVVYNEELSLPDDLDVSNLCDWELKGWFTEELGQGQKIVSVRNYVGTGNCTLFGYWTIDNVELNYGNPDQASTYLSVLEYGKSIQETGQRLPLMTEVYDRSGYTKANKWVNVNNEEVTNSSQHLPLKMMRLNYQWTPRADIIVTLNHNAGTATVSNAYNGIIRATMGELLENKSDYIPKIPSYTFLGYYYGDNEEDLYYSADMTGCKPWDHVPVGDENIVLKALWGEPCVITLDPDIPYDSNYNDKEGAQTVRVRKDAAMPGGYAAPTRAGYTFDGYYERKDGNGQKYYDSKMVSAHPWDQSVDIKSATIYANWIKNNITATASSTSLSDIKDGDTKTSTITGGNGSGKYSFAVVSTSHPNATVSVNGNGVLSVKSNSNKDDKGTVTVRVTDNRTGKTKDCSVSYSTKKEGCFIEGTLITLADGTVTPIENIQVGDKVLSWNFFTGELEAQPVAYVWNYGLAEYETVNLSFANGAQLSIIASHGLFDATSNRFEYIDKDNFDSYIGHDFVVVQGDYISTTQLVNVNISQQVIGCYSLETAQNGNAIAEGLLTLTPQEYIELFMCFELGDNMKYDQEKMQADIAQYGLYTYDEWKDYVTEDEFNAFNGQYMKIVVGKGLVTEEQLKALIAKWL